MTEDNNKCARTIVLLLKSTTDKHIARPPLMSSVGCGWHHRVLRGT